MITQTPTATTAPPTPILGSSRSAQRPASANRHPSPNDRTLTPGTTSDPARGEASPIVESPDRDLVSGPSAIRPATPTAGSLADPMLALLADMLDDLEKTRIANENRLRQLTRTEVDKDGHERGFGLPLDSPQALAVRSLVDGLAAMEHQATLLLQRAVRKHPLGPWIKNTAGVGEKQGARLLAAIGDPYWNALHDRQRTVSELWAYCGYHILPAGSGTQLGLATHTSSGVAASRSKGQRANWSSTAKMRAFLVAEACMKCRQSPYREVYDKARAKYLLAQHEQPCKRCGPAGKPALPGSDLSDGHKHARALRIVAKEVLKDLWRESKRLHDEEKTCDVT